MNRKFLAQAAVRLSVVCLCAMLPPILVLLRPVVDLLRRNGGAKASEGSFRGEPWK